MFHTHDINIMSKKSSILSEDFSPHRRPPPHPQHPHCPKPQSHHHHPRPTPLLHETPPLTAAGIRRIIRSVYIKVEFHLLERIHWHQLAPLREHCAELLLLSLLNLIIG